MKKKLAILFIGATFAISPLLGKSNKKFVAENFQFAKEQLSIQERLSPESDGYPRTLRKEQLYCTRRNDWTDGFFPGSLWYIYEATKEQADKEAAVKWTLPLEKLQHLTSHHDIGFLMYCSYGSGYRLTQEASYKPILIQSAKSLCTRFNEKTGVIKSWNYRESWDKKHKWYYPVIIDNMMNLELLYFASKETGDPSFAQVATRHAEVTMKNHIRPDFGTYHVVNYDPQNGDVLFRGTCQGYADESTWARGQSWAIYGFTLVYRETKDKRFLECAEKLADFWLNNSQLPQDMIPYWDFNVKTSMQPADWALNRTFDKQNPPRDASAAAITCSALFELAQYSKEGKRYRKAAEATLYNLAKNYRAELGTNGGFILKHSVGSLPHNSEIDVPLVYADYYFLEALHRMKTMK